MTLKRWIHPAFVLGTLLPLALLATNSSAQCPCPPPAPNVRAAYDGSSVVFIGRVDRITKSALKDGKYEVKFSILRKFKGFDEIVGENVVLFTPIDAKLCGYQFLVGQDYIVYGTGNPAAYLATSCTRTGILDNLLDDIDPLTSFASGPAPSSAPAAQQPSPPPPGNARAMPRK